MLSFLLQQLLPWRFLRTPQQVHSYIVVPEEPTDSMGFEENVTVTDTAHDQATEHPRQRKPTDGTKLKRLLARCSTRKTYEGSLLFNLFAFFLPALYSTLSKLWVANIDSSQVVTTDVYTYIGVIAQVLNDGLPRAAWLIIGDKSNRTISSRIGISYSLILAQTILGLLMTIVFIGAAESLAAAFVPIEVRASSLTYVRISSIEALSSALTTAVSACTRALDQPDVPVVIGIVQFTVNIVLDMLLISKFHVGSFIPTVNTQALTQMACNMSAAVAGLVYFIYISIKAQRQVESSSDSAKPSFGALMKLVKPSVYTFTESAVRNAIYLWLVSRIVLMGETYATAWGIFNTIRWGLIMVPVQALEASTLTFVGHKWGQWRTRVGSHAKRAKATRSDVREIVCPALVSLAIAFVFEVLICISLSTHGMQSFAYYLSQSVAVAEATQTMWKTVDWCYIFYGLDYQVGAILLAAAPRWYLIQSATANCLWDLPWAIVVTVAPFTQARAWTFYAIIFGGALVFDFITVTSVTLLWARRLMQGKIKLPPI